MLRRRHTSTSPDSDDASAAPSSGSRSGSRIVRLTVVIFLLASFTPLLVGIVLSLPPARVAGSMQMLSDAWARVVALTPLAEQRQMAAGEATRHPEGIAAWSPGPVAPRAGEQGVLTYGDKLKISFFESLSVPIEGNRADPAVTIFPRMDLTAEHTVDESGSVNVPKLGQFVVAGQTITAAQSLLANAFRKATGRTSDVHVAILERQPIYVVGTVRTAGTFKHTPGMTVLQALADAGGNSSDNVVMDTSRAIESIRETQRLRQAESKLDRLMVGQAKLQALRDNASSLPVPPSIKARVAQAAPQDNVRAVVAEAEASLGLERARYQQQASLAERQVSIARADVEAQKLRVEQMKVLLAKKAERLRDMEAIAARGSVSQFKLTDVQADLSELATKHEEGRVAVAASERRLLDAEMSLTKLQREQAVGIEKELATTQQEIEDGKLAVTAMRSVIQVLRGNGPDLGNASGGPPDLRITRRSAEGIVVMPATETSTLLPGDVLQVNVPIRTEKPGTGTEMKHLQN